MGDEAKRFRVTVTNNDGFSDAYEHTAAEIADLARDLGDTLHSTASSVVITPIV